MAGCRFIYGLVDCVTKDLRYVGSTTVGMKRPNHHLLPCAYNKSRQRVYAWVKAAMALGCKPEIVILEHVSPDTNIITIETFYIRLFRALGCNLLNATGKAGGTGMTGKRHSVATREKISLSKRGTKLSQEARKNIGEASRRRGISHEAILAAARAKLGKSRTEETKEKIRQKLKGRKQPEAQKAATSEAMKKWWEERRGGI